MERGETRTPARADWLRHGVAPYPPLGSRSIAHIYPSINLRNKQKKSAPARRTLEPKRRLLMN